MFRSLVLVAALAGAASAATYTVDNTNATASDANPGTAAAPWKTLAKAVTTVKAGDTCIVQAGTYAERPTLRTSGASGAPIVFRAGTPRGVTTNGFDITGSYIRVEGFHVGKTQLGYTAPVLSSGAHVELVGNVVEYAQHFGIDSEGAGVLISGNRIYGCGSGIVTSGDDALVENNEVERLIFTGFDDADYSRGWGTNVTFRGNWFHGTRYANDIASSVPHIDGFQTFFGGLHHLVFENNWVESFHEGLMIEGLTDPAQAGSVSDLMIRNNVFFGYAEDFDSAWGVCVKDGTYVLNVQVYDNVMYRIHWYGAGIGTTCTGTIRDNIMMNIANDGTPYFGDGGNNLLFNTSATAASKPNATDLIGDPRFVDVAHLRGADGVPFTADDGVHLAAGSPAIDAGAALPGLVDNDAYGNARPSNGRWDIGVQEVVGGSSTGNQPPTVALTTPSSGSTYQAPATIALAANAADADGTVAKVEFYDGSTLIASDATAPYAFTWIGAAVGSHSLTAKAYDDKGATTTSAAVTVSVSGASQQPDGATIWDASAAPAHPADADTAAVEVGVKLTSDVAGTITGIRFYKGAGNGGTHVGHLWSRTGALLGSATFTGETADGWQQATFAQPIAIQANTTYVASYHTDVGHYAGDNGYFTGHGVDRAPLHALADGVDGGNGVYRYGASAFPTDTWQASNYWVDVVFAKPTGGGIVAGQWYELVAKHSGKCLDVEGVSTADGANVHQWTDWNGANQQWRLDAQSDGSYVVISRNSGKALDVAGWSTADGGNVIQWTLHGGANQRWRLGDTGGGWYRVINVNSGKVLDVSGVSTADGANVQQWTDVGGDNQRWQLVPVAPTGSG